MHPADQKILNDIEEFGWSVMIVAGGEQEFAYTIGIHQTFGQPEFLIFGFSRETLHALCNQYGNDVKVGKTYRQGDRTNDWFENEKVQVAFLGIHDGWKPFFLGRLVDLMGDPTIPALQGWWSDNEGKFPPEEGFDPELKDRQFYLNDEPEY